MILVAFSIIAIAMPSIIDFFVRSFNKGFADLDVEVLRSPRRGRAVIGYKFKWTADKQIRGQINMTEYLASQNKGKTKGKANKKAVQSKSKKAYKDFEQSNTIYDESLLLDN